MDLAQLTAIVIPVKASREEARAGEELQFYLRAMGAKNFRVVPEDKHDDRAPAIFVGATKAAEKAGLRYTPGEAAETLRIRTVAAGLILTGSGPRGTFYAVSEFLRNVCGVEWWNPFEEGVPTALPAPIGELDIERRRAFEYRDINLYSNDGGRFAAHLGFNSEEGIAPGRQYGGGVGYGPPGFVHTFFKWAPPATYFAKHPHWYSLVGGKRIPHGQLCLTEPTLRAHILVQLEHLIRANPEARDFDISQNDTLQLWCQCPECTAAVELEGSQSGPLLGFINYIARKIEPKYPQIRIHTLAFAESVDPPRRIAPYRNVVIRLAETQNDLRVPFQSQPGGERLKAWIAKGATVWLWLYGIVYGLEFQPPWSRTRTLTADIPYFHSVGAKGVFVEQEEPILGGAARDLDVWLTARLLQEPAADAKALRQTYLDGFFGPAAAKIDQYFSALEKDSEGAHIWFLTGLTAWNWLTGERIKTYQRRFAEMEPLVAADNTLVMRILHARLPLDLMNLAAFRRIDQPEEDVATIAARARAAIAAQIALRISPASQADERSRLGRVVDRLAEQAGWALAPLPPTRFSRRAIDLPMDVANVCLAGPGRGPSWVVDQGASLGGRCLKYAIAPDENASYVAPAWGVFDGQRARWLKHNAMPTTLRYDWTGFPVVNIVRSCSVHCLDMGAIQIHLHGIPAGVYDVWMRYRVQGKLYGGDGENAIFIDRVVLDPVRRA